MLGGVLDDVEDIMDDTSGIERLLAMREVTKEVLSKFLSLPIPVVKGYLGNDLIVWVYPQELWLFLILVLLQQSSWYHVSCIYGVANGVVKCPWIFALRLWPHLHRALTL